MSTRGLGLVTFVEFRELTVSEVEAVVNNVTIARMDDSF